MRTAEAVSLVILTFFPRQVRRDIEALADLKPLGTPQPSSKDRTVYWFRRQLPGFMVDLSTFEQGSKGESQTHM